MKQILLLMMAVVLVGCATTQPHVLSSDKNADALLDTHLRVASDRAVREFHGKAAKKPTGELTEVNYENLTKCGISSNPPLTEEESAARSAKIIERAIRKATKKPTGELTKADLEKVTQLKFLRDQQLTDVTGLENLPHLKELLLSDFHRLPKGLEKLTQLEVLNLLGSQLTEVPKWMEKLTHLKGLGLYRNKLTSVEGLEKLTKLEGLDLQLSSNLTKAQIDQLKKALPNCRIAWSAKR